MTTPQHKDTTLDDVLVAYARFAVDSPNLPQRFVKMSHEEAKQALLQWRDKAVVEALINELKAPDTISFTSTGNDFIYEIRQSDIDKRIEAIQNGKI